MPDSEPVGKLTAPPQSDLRSLRAELLQRRRTTRLLRYAVAGMLFAILIAAFLAWPGVLL